MGVGRCKGFVTVNIPFSSLSPAFVKAVVERTTAILVDATQPGDIYPHQMNMYEQDDSLGSVVDIHLVLVALLEVALDLLAKDGGPVLTVFTEQSSQTVNHSLDGFYGLFNRVQRTGLFKRKLRTQTLSTVSTDLKSA